MNEIVGEDISHDKDFDASIKIIKLLPIVGWRTLGNTWIKRKSSITFNDMVDITKWGNKMLVSSKDKIHTTCLEIEEWCTQTQKKLQKEHIDYFKFRENE
jgi:hypothetical protein